MLSHGKTLSIKAEAESEETKARSGGGFAREFKASKSGNTKSRERVGKLSKKTPDTHTKKGKKEAQRLKNRKLFEIFSVADRAAGNVDIGTPEVVAAPEPEKTVVQLKEEDALERMQQIRNRVSGRKRASKDKWNRFAGTSGGGGRGR